MTGTEPPPVWFRLPPGYHDFSSQSIEALREALPLFTDDATSERAERQTGEFIDHLEQLPAHHVLHTSLGLHPDGEAGFVTSLFSLSVRPCGQNNPRLAVARASLGIARAPSWLTVDCRFLELPSALPCSLVTGTQSVPGRDSPVSQARLVLAHTAGSHVVIADLTSAATQHADAYADILEGIAHTIAFTDPASVPQAKNSSPTSRILDVLS
ncbi:hypothetical protein [Streptomyces sp. G-G2]|uniref:hypothetical protein n=1 Tax=Streptomyces sp. G-G2 TaxID=3046201 RepID=UPI0024BBE5AF|nr:hypothetical protein [Streptomyces sp. G-G2]MDJ0382677.1 hypothetical protein [Streptomyces sp. G-G2]